MGTRSLVEFIDLYGPIVTIYQQYDGYPSGVGLNLAEFLASGTLVNGYSLTDERQFNGVGCMAAQYIAENKKGVGNLYIEQPGARDMGEEYIYQVFVGGRLWCAVTEVYGNNTHVFNTIENFIDFCERGG